ncbi:MAG TPA: histidine kinase [Candidatus Limosilactobacillus faecipullorum]|nr:histidine kinase [Candidatus Limosilactobacillus faecipullorum]
MMNLAILVAEQVGLVILLAFVLVNIPLFRRMLLNLNWRNKIGLYVIFASFAILSNMIGVLISPSNEIIRRTLLVTIPHGYSVANVRVITVTVAGIVGGPYVGGAVGLTAGGFRALQEGFSPEALFYIPSSFIIGVISGLFYDQRQQRFSPLRARNGFFIGLIMECIQMSFVLLCSPMGWTLVKFIALPMILISSIGTTVFLMIIRFFFQQELAAQAAQTRTVLNLALSTLPVFQKGFTAEAAQTAVHLIYQYTSFDAVSITDRRRILAFEGAGSDHHLVDQKLTTDISIEAMTEGIVEVANTEERIGCKNPDCPLNSAVIIPLSLGDEIIGTLKLYYTQRWRLTPVEIQLGTGIGQILSTQIMLGKASYQSELLRDVEIKSLQSQVNPHFFFNAINTIMAVMRRDPKEARKLLLSLSTYFRDNLMGARETLIPLAQEYEHVQAYLTLAQARFPGKYQVTFSDYPAAALIPPFSIQVLVENALRHAFGQRKEGNRVKVTIQQRETELEISVADNGQGIDPDKLPELGKKVVASKEGSGTALQNLNERLHGLYDPHTGLEIKSSPTGTTVKMRIPYQTHEQKERTEQQA